MVLVGERSSNMSQALERTGAYYGAQYKKRMETFSRLAQPLLLVILGAVIATIMLAIILPMTDLSGLE
jgi:type II secretory pathway component PulF